MPDRTEPVLVIADGELESLVAMLLLEAPEQAQAWFIGAGADESPLRRRATQIQVESAGLEQMIDPTTPADAWASLPGGLGESAMLLSALADAAARGCADVVWPRASDGDLDSMTDSADRALLVERLGVIESARTESLDVRLRTPLLDLSDRQIAELAADLAAPVWSCWWALPEAGDRPDAEPERLRWSDLLSELGAAALFDRPRPEPATF